MIFKKIKICSLFSGIGGFETGIFNAIKKENCEVVFASEIDKFASRAYELIYRHKPYGDITLIDEKEIPDHDLLIAGFPCQAFSVAGKRLGFEDTRGTLFFEIARIAREKKPKVLLLENVKGLLSHRQGDTISTMIGILSDIGYKVDYEILNSKYFGVAQNRERVIIVAIREIEAEEWDLNKCHPIVKATKEKIKQMQDIQTFNFDYPKQIEVTKRIRDFLEEYVPEKYYMEEEKTHRLIEEIKSKIEETDFKEGDIHKIYDIPREIINDNERQRRLYGIEGISPTLLARSDTPKILLVGYLDMKAGKQIRSVYDQDGLSPTIDTAQGGHRQVKILLKPEYRIRKLTPLECFRLQGFPDEYYHILRENKFSDTQLYKMTGNAVTTTKIEKVFEKVLAYLV